MDVSKSANPRKKQSMKRITKRILFASAFLAVALTINARDTYPNCDGWWTSESGENPTYCPNASMTSPAVIVSDCAYVVYSPAKCWCQGGSGTFTDIAECWSVDVNGSETYWSCKNTDCAGTYSTWTCSCASPYTYGPSATMIPTINFTLCPLGG